MSHSLEFLRFPPLGFISKARLAATIFCASWITNWRPLENIPVADWLWRWSGAKTFEKIWLPLLRSKLGESYRKTSAAFIWATIQRMHAARRSGLKKEMFGYVPGGYARILDAFHKHLTNEGVEIVLEAQLESVKNEGDEKVTLSFVDGSQAIFDQAVLTVPSKTAARICPGLPLREKQLLEGIEYQGIVCASLLLKKPLGSYYITNITDSWVPFTAVIEMSAFVDRDEFGGKSLVYLPKYLASDHDSFAIKDDEWRRRFVEALMRMYPDLETSDILSFKLSRERFVYALPTLGYSSRLAPRKTALPGVWIVNSSQIVNGTLNVNETIKLAESAVTELLVWDDASTSNRQD
jgi:protoporphyrinogen oxidase